MHQRLATNTTTESNHRVEYWTSSDDIIRKNKPSLGFAAHTTFGQTENRDKLHSIFSEMLGLRRRTVNAAPLEAPSHDLHTAMNAVIFQNLTLLKYPHRVIVTLFL